MAGWFPLGVLQGQTGWAALKLGAGGFLSGVSIADDNTMVIRTDTYGGYIWNPSNTSYRGNDGTTGAWEQLVRWDRLPADIQAMPEIYADGVYELLITSNDSNTLYMAYYVFGASIYPPQIGVYKSTNKGASWTRTNFTAIDDTFMHANETYRGYGPKGAIYPADASTVFMGSGTGLYLTKNGGTSWTALTNGTNGIPAAAIYNSSYPGYTGWAFVPGTPTTVFVYSATNGIYKSTNANAIAASISFTQIAAHNAGGKPQGAIKTMVAFANGNLAVIDENATLWSFNGTTWTSVITAATKPMYGVAVDPNNTARAIAVGSDGCLTETTNSGGTWGSLSNNNGVTNPASVATYSDVPWMSVLGTLTPYGVIFDRSTSNKIWAIPNFRAPYYCQLSGTVVSGTAPIYVEQARGIEQMVGNEIICPKANQPIGAAWDSAVFKFDVIGNTYATTFGPVADGSVVASWSIDGAYNDPDFLIMVGSGFYAGGPSRFYKSANYGSSWSTYTPATASTVAEIACSTSTNWLWAETTTAPYYTANAGSSWTQCTFPGSPSFASFGGPYFTGKRSICADRVNANTFYCALGGVGFYRSTDGGVTWTQRKADATVTNFNSWFKSAPSVAGDVWYASGVSGNAGSQPGSTTKLQRSTDGGATWSSFSSVASAYTVGFGAPQPSQGTYLYSVYAVAWVSGVFGFWRSDDYGATWVQLTDSLGGAFPEGNIDTVKAISGDAGVWNRCYIALKGSGFKRWN